MAVLLEPSPVRKTVRADDGCKHQPLRKRPWMRWAVAIVVVAYSLTLGASAYERWRLQKSPISLPEDKRSMSISAVAGDHVLPKEITMAFRDVSAQGDSDRIPVVLIHGSPGSGDVLKLIAAPIQGPRRVL